MLDSVLPSPANILISAFSFRHSKCENAKETNQSPTQTHLPPQWEEAADAKAFTMSTKPGVEPRRTVHPLVDSDSKAPHPPPPNCASLLFQ